MRSFEFQTRTVRSGKHEDSEEGSDDVKEASSDEAPGGLQGWLERRMI